MELEGQATKMDVRGLYCFPMSNPKLAIKSSGYSVYSELFEDGVFWTVMYELQVARWMGGQPGIGKITAEDQWVCKTGHARDYGPMYHCTAVWYHALTHTDCAEAVRHLLVSMDRFLPEYEVKPLSDSRVWVPRAVCRS